jgi:iron complex transport system ATP-binding protein
MSEDVMSEDVVTASVREVTDVSARTALRLSALDVTLDGVPVLRGVDLDVRTGEWLGVIGPNGAGKSTLLRAITGLVRSSGSVTLGDGARPRPTDVALVPQSPVLPPGMSVVEYVLLGRTAHLRWLARESRHDRDVATGVLRRLDLARFAERSVSQLSGGEAQRVVVARALAQRAGVLLLDEPTSALDLGHQAEVLELVDELRHDDGLTVLAAMHDLSTAGRYADRLLLLDRGEVAALDTGDQVLDPVLLSTVYRTPLEVHRLDDRLVVTPGPRRRPSAPSDLARHRRGRGA